MLPVAVLAQALDTAKIDQVLGRAGQKLGDVYKFGFPRTDLHVSVHGLAIKPGLALGSWAAFTGTDDDAMAMGDLVLLEDDVNPVIEKLVGRSLGSAAMHADAKQTEFCTYLSAILLAGLLLNTFFELWWADPLAALIMVPIIAKEGIDGVRDLACSDCCAGIAE